VREGVGTVKKHVQRLLADLEVTDRTQAAVVAPPGLSQITTRVVATWILRERGPPA
jgi:hypothetical protein